MKAYLDDDGHVRLFRPLDNMKRMNTSMQRMALGGIDPEACVELIKKFVLLEKSWIPQGRGYSLYLRPTAIATDAGLGVHASHNSKLYASLVGSDSLATSSLPLWVPTTLLASSPFVLLYPFHATSAPIPIEFLDLCTLMKSTRDLGLVVLVSASAVGMECSTPRIV